MGGNDALPSSPIIDPNDDSRVYFNYHIGYKEQTPSQHIVIANWGHHAAKRSASECGSAITTFLLNAKAPLPTFGRVCSSKTCLSFVNIESAVQVFGLLESDNVVMTLGRRIRSAYSVCEIQTKRNTRPRPAVTWSTYLSSTATTDVNDDVFFQTTTKRQKHDDKDDNDDDDNDYDFVIPFVPGLLLILDAIGVDEETKLVEEIHTQGGARTEGWSTCARKEARESQDFDACGHRRVMHFGRKFDYDTRGVGDQATGGCLPSFLTKLAERIRQYCEVHDEEKKKQEEQEEQAAEEEEDAEKSGNRSESAFDQCTVNEYRPGHGIAAHVDTHSVFGTMLVSLSLVGTSVMSFVHSIDGKLFLMFIVCVCVFVCVCLVLLGGMHSAAVRVLIFLLFFSSSVLFV